MWPSISTHERKNKNGFSVVSFLSVYSYGSSGKDRETYSLAELFASEFLRINNRII